MPTYQSLRWWNIRLISTSSPLRKLKNDSSPTTAWCIEELLKTYNAAPAKMSSGATTPGAEDATALAVLKRLLIQWMSPHVQLTGAIKIPVVRLMWYEKKLAKDRSRLDSRKYFFSQRVIISGMVFQQKW